MTGNIVFFEHTGTDESFGDTDFDSEYEFKETDAFHPNNPYSATKTAADQLIAACHHTYNDFDYCIVRGCNNYGPGQHCEKFVPMVAKNALFGENIPIHGLGNNIREWIYVKDFARTFLFLHDQYRTNKEIVRSQTFNSGSGVRMKNIDIAKRILEQSGTPVKLEHVVDRPGNDRRYAIDSSKIRNLGFNLLYSNIEENIQEIVKEMRIRYGFSK
jgi:dTDP-glucose 4,6-dehydratase